jgi:hypothetical protein
MVKSSKNEYSKAKNLFKMNQNVNIDKKQIINTKKVDHIIE